MPGSRQGQEFHRAVKTAGVQSVSPNAPQAVGGLRCRSNPGSRRGEHNGKSLHLPLTEKTAQNGQKNQHPIFTTINPPCLPSSECSPRRRPSVYTEPRGLCCAERTRPPAPRMVSGGARLARRPPGSSPSSHRHSLCPHTLQAPTALALPAPPGSPPRSHQPCLCPPRSPAPQMPRQPREALPASVPPHPLYPGASAPNPSPARSTWSDHRCHLSGSPETHPHPAARGLLAPHPIRVPDALAVPRPPGPQPPAQVSQLCFVRSPPATRALHQPHALKGQGPRVSQEPGGGEP